MFSVDSEEGETFHAACLAPELRQEMVAHLPTAEEFIYLKPNAVEIKLGK